MEVRELHRSGRGGFPIRFVLGDFFKMRPEVAGTFEVRYLLGLSEYACLKPNNASTHPALCKSR